MPVEHPLVIGHTDPPFEALRDVFARLAGSEGGAVSLAVVFLGRVVADLRTGGYRDGSLQMLFSISKAVTAVAAAMAVERGLLDLDEPLSADWPEFDRTSTRGITPRMVLSHASGLAAVDETIGFDDLLAGAEEIALGRQEPYWEPGTAHGYHAFTFGTLMNGVFRRRLGISVGSYLAENISAPLGIDLWLGTPSEVLERVRPVSYPAAVLDGAVRSERIPAGSSGRLQQSMDFYNDPRMLAAEFPSTNAVSDARSLAVLFDRVLDGSLIGSGALADLTRVHSDGNDLVLNVPTRFGAGVQLPFPRLPLLGPRSFGHEAAGGSVVAADPALGLSVAILTDRFPSASGASPAALALLPAVRYCAGLGG